MKIFYILITLVLAIFVISGCVRQNEYITKEICEIEKEYQDKNICECPEGYGFEPLMKWGSCGNSEISDCPVAYGYKCLKNQK